MGATLSLAMIVKNESRFIERVLESIRPACDEMIVLDTGSTDDTVEKARAMGAHVEHFTWIDDFATARNTSFGYCTSDWIIWLDADDVVPPETLNAILEMKQSTLNSSIDAVYMNYDYGPARPYFVRERLIRRGVAGIEWRHAIHECIYGIMPERSLRRTDLSILHRYDPADIPLKSARNIALLHKQFDQGERNDRLLMQLITEYEILGNTDEKTAMCHLVTEHSTDPLTRCRAYTHLAKQADIVSEQTKSAFDYYALAMAAEPRLPDAPYALALKHVAAGHYHEAYQLMLYALKCYEQPDDFCRLHSRISQELVEAYACYTALMARYYHDALALGQKALARSDAFKDNIEINMKAASEWLSKGH